MALEQSISCFDWQCRSSDYLDGRLPQVEKRQMDHHTESCKDCNRRFNHYQTIVGQIAALPQSQMPESIQKVDSLALAARTRMLDRGLFRWDRLPWYFRTSLEGMGIILFVVAGMSS